MNPLQQLWRSTLGKKYVMALTGAGLFAFVIGHMAGNLQFFLAPEYINKYGHFLQTTPELLWSARLGLAAMVLLHILAALSLTVQNRASRPRKYAGGPPFAASLASRTMIFSGLIIAAFVIYHLLHFTVMVPAVNGLPGADGQPLDFRILAEPKTGYHDVFAMIVFGFQQPVVAVSYIIAVGLLCFHLGHGVAAMFQSLGFRNHVWGPRIAALARAASVILFLGYASIPLSVMFGRGAEYLNQVTTNVKAPASLKAH